MKTDVDTCLKDIADFYVKNRREITEPELEIILKKHCESEKEMQKFAHFLGTEPGQHRFKTILIERKGESRLTEKQPPGREELNTFALGKELERFVPGFHVEAMTVPGPKFSVSVGEIDDEKKHIRLNLWEDASRNDALAVLAHEYSHIKKGTTEIEKGLTEVEVWRRGESCAKDWGVLPEYLNLARGLAQFYESRKLYPGLSEGMRKWLETRPVPNTHTVSGFKIPTTRVTSLGIDLELPVARAVEALIDENPWSSGFHAALNQRWTIVFRGKISGRAVKAARAAGLEVSYRELLEGSGQFLTDVSLPAVGVTEIEKATKAFNRFAELYEGKPSYLKEPIKERAGRCYELAWRHITEQNEGTLIHGQVWSQLGRMIDHAWVETETGYIYEPESDSYHPKDWLYKTYKIKKFKRYTPDQARILALKTGKFGPWALRCKYCKTAVPSSATDDNVWAGYHVKVAHRDKIPELAKITKGKDGASWLAALEPIASEKPSYLKGAPTIHEATSENPAELMPVEVSSAFPEGAPSVFNPQEKAQIDRFINEVPDKNDTRAINYWLDWGDRKVYLEGWIDKCLTGTGFPPMEGGEWDEKIQYMVKDTHKTLIRKQKKEELPLWLAQEVEGLTLIEGGFREFNSGDKAWLYGVTWGVYKPSYLKGSSSKLASLPKFYGKAWRVEYQNWGIPSNATAGDVIRFEKEELGNDYGLPQELISELDKYSVSDIVWVTKSREDAKKYLSEGRPESDITEVEGLEGGRIVAEDGEGGYLVLRPTEGSSNPNEKDRPW